jgi:hypothetical protein
MSSASASLTALRSGRRSVTTRLADDGLVLTVVGFFLTILAAATPYFVQPDSWLTFLGGREIAASGIPHRDPLALMSHGREWIDQQWLAQLFTYRLESTFGLGATIVLYSVLVAVPFVYVCRFARLSASARSVSMFAVLALPCSFCALRAQAFAYLFFPPLLALLCLESRRATRRVWLALPLLVVWANVHGSVLVAAALVVLLGLSDVVEGRRRRGAGLAAGAVASVFATPYGLSLLGYYHSTIGNPLFKQYISEWAPPTFPSWAGVPFFVIAGAGVIAIARHPRVLTKFEIAALGITFLGGLTAVRSVVWFTYAATMLLPRTLDRLWPPQQVARKVRLGLAWMAAATFVLCLGFAVNSAVHESQHVRASYPPAAIAVVRKALAANPHARVLADDRTADWLLYELPEVRGRIAFDGRWEVLSQAQFRVARDYIQQASPNARRLARHYQIFVLDRGFNTWLARWYATGDFRVLYRGSHVAVYERSS